jgi:hypothetical protein
MTYSVKTQDPLRAPVGCCNSVLSGSRDGVISSLRLRPGPLRRDRTRRITVTGHGYACTVT